MTIGDVEIARRRVVPLVTARSKRADVDLGSGKLTTQRSTLEWLVCSVWGPTPFTDPRGDVAIDANRGSRVETQRRVIVLTRLAYGLVYLWPGVTLRVIGVALAGSSPAGRDAAVWFRRVDGRTPSESISGLSASSNVATR